MKTFILTRVNSFASTTNEYSPVSSFGSFDGTEGLRYQPWAVAGSFSNAIINLEVAPGSGKSYTFTLWVNGLATAVVVTISDLATTGRDTTHSAAITAGQSLSWKKTSSGTPATTAARFSIEFDSTNVKESGYGSSSMNSSGTTYRSIFGSHSTAHSTAILASEVVPIAGSITGTSLLSWSATPPGAGNCSYTIILNGVLQDGSGGTVDTRCIYGAGTSVSATFDLPVVAGDVVCYSVVNNNSYVGYSTRFLATTDGESIVAGGGTDTMNSITTYNYLSGFAGLGSGGAWNAGSLTLYGTVTTFTLSKMQIYLQVAPGGVTARTLSLQKNLAAAGPTALITGTAITGSDATNTANIADGDTVGMKHVPTSTPAGSGGRWTFRAVRKAGGGSGSSKGNSGGKKGGGGINAYVPGGAALLNIGNCVDIGSGS